MPPEEVREQLRKEHAQPEMTELLFERQTDERLDPIRQQIQSQDNFTKNFGKLKGQKERVKREMKKAAREESRRKRDALQHQQLTGTVKDSSEHLLGEEVGNTNRQPKVKSRSGASKN